MYNKKHKIAVMKNNEIIGYINRVLVSEAIGNFNPIFCTYKGERELVLSEGGDISDPFRREGSYLNTLYIKL